MEPQEPEDRDDDERPAPEDTYKGDLQRFGEAGIKLGNALFEEVWGFGCSINDAARRALRRWRR